MDSRQENNWPGRPEKAIRSWIIYLFSHDLTTTAQEIQTSFFPQPIHVLVAVPSVSALHTEQPTTMPSWIRHCKQSHHSRSLSYYTCHKSLHSFLYSLFVLPSCEFVKCLYIQGKLFLLV